MTFEEWFYENYGNLEFTQVIKNALKEIAFKSWQAAIQQQWQPIETAPRDGEFILVCTNDGFITSAYMRKNKTYTQFGDIEIKEIVYWQPLPQPPNV